MTTHPLHRDVEFRGPGVASPGDKAPTKTPELPETREHHDITVPGGISRRRLLGWMAGGAVALGGGAAMAVELLNGKKKSEAPAAGNAPAPAASEAQPVPTALPEGDFERVPKVFSKELTLDEIRAAGKAANLNPATIQEACANFSQDLRYAVNVGDTDLVRRLIPGGSAGKLQPDQFALRAEWWQDYRTSAKGTMMDNPNDPNNPAYSAWGFELVPVKQLSQVGADLTSPNTYNYLVQALLRIGDYRPTLPGKGTRSFQIERPLEVPAVVVFGRAMRVEGFGFTPFPDGGVGIDNLALPQDLPFPPRIAATMPYKEFASIPDLGADQLAS